MSGLGFFPGVITLGLMKVTALLLVACVALASGCSSVQPTATTAVLSKDPVIRSRQLAERALHDGMLKLLAEDATPTATPTAVALATSPEYASR